MNPTQKEILQKFATQKVELARSSQIINAANKLMNKSESIQDKTDSNLNLFEKAFDGLILQGRELKANIGDMSNMQNDIKKEMSQLEALLKELGAPTSASKEYGLLENALKGLKDYIALGNKLNNKLNKYY
jgi:hypothetical protein